MIRPRLVALMLIASCGGRAWAAEDPLRDVPWPPTAAQVLAARGSASPHVRGRAAGVASLYADDWAKSGGSDAAARLAEDMLAWLHDERDGWAAHELAAALESLGDTVGAEKWEGLLGHRDPSARAVASRAVAGHLTPRSEQRLLSLLRSEPHAWVRVEQISALRGGNSEESLDVLHAALADPVPEIRASASLALARRARPRSLGPLLAAVDDPALQGWESPILALGATREPAALPAILGATTSPSRAVREHAASALGLLGGPDVLAPLGVLLRDESSSVQDRAAEALAGMGTPEAALVLLRRLAEPPGTVDFSGEHPVPAEGDVNLLAHALRAPFRDAVAAAAALVTLDSPSATEITDLSRAIANHSGGHLVSWSSGDLHEAVYDLHNSSTRVVRPARGSTARAWDLAIGRRRDGEPLWLPRGARVTALDHAFVDGETWVNAAAGPHGGGWVRERDLRRPTPRDLARWQGQNVELSADTRAVIPAR